MCSFGIMLETCLLTALQYYKKFKSYSILCYDYPDKELKANIKDIV